MSKKKIKKGKKIVSKKPVKKVVKATCLKHVLEIKKPFGKSHIAGTIACMVGLSKKDSSKTIEALSEIIGAHLKKKGPGEFTFPGIAKFRVVTKPATKARQGINPFTGQPMMFAAKPARNVIKIRALKKLKDLAK